MMEKNDYWGIDLSLIYETCSDPNNFADVLSDMRKQLGFDKIIAFSGWWTSIAYQFEDDNLMHDVKQYSTMVKTKIIDEIISKLSDYNVAILTWWTNWDVPKIATTLARNYQLPTIGVMPEKAKATNSLAKYNLLNLELSVPPMYGDSHYWDESSIFSKLADGMFVIWWWSWTLIEFGHAIKINEKLTSDNKKCIANDNHEGKRELKKIIPVLWIPGVSDLLLNIPWDKDTKNGTFPELVIDNAQEAFECMKNEVLKK